MHRIECPSCGQRLKFGDEHIGKKGKCTRCGTAVRLTLEAAAPPPAAPPPPPLPTRPPPPVVAPALKKRESQVTATTVGPSGVTYTESRCDLSAISGSYSSDTLGCAYSLLSADGWHVYHAGGQRGFFGTLEAMLTTGVVDTVLDGEVFQPEGGSAEFRFSPDCRHYGHFNSRPEGICLTIDGREVSPRYAEAFQPVLSNDATGWAFVAKVGKKFHVVHNGRVGPEFDEIKPDSLRISDCGRAVAYMATRGKQSFAVLGEREFPQEAPGATFVSVDGTCRASVEKTKEGQRIVFNGRPGEVFEKLDETSLCFSPDGTQVAYAARRAGKWHVFRNAEVGPAYAEIAPKSLCFSPDGRRFAYAACAKTSWLSGWLDSRVVLDGVEQPVYTRVDQLLFSPDNRRFAYAAVSKKGTHLILDGVEQGTWEGLSALTFSPDSRHTIFLAPANDGTKQVLVIDGKAGQPYDSVGQIGFTADGRHVVAMAYGKKYSDPEPGFWSGEVKREGGFLVINNEYESKEWIRSPSPTPYNRVYHTEVRIGFAGADTLYAVSMYATESQVSFSRVDVRCTLSGGGVP